MSLAEHMTVIADRELPRFVEKLVDRYAAEILATVEHTAKIGAYEFYWRMPFLAIEGDKVSLTCEHLKLPLLRGLMAKMTGHGFVVYVDADGGPTGGLYIYWDRTPRAWRYVKRTIRRALCLSR